MPTISLSDIAPEILTEIFGFLDAKTILSSCSSIHQVQKLWYEIVKCSPELQYTIELLAAGMVRGDPGTLTCGETLGMLHEYRRAWRNMTWRAKTVLDIEPISRWPTLALVGAVFAELKGADFRAISLSRIVHDAENATTSHKLGIDLEGFQDFVIDPTQDLVAFAYLPDTGRRRAVLELRTLSAHQPHPLALEPQMAFPLDYESEGLAIQVVDDIMALVMHVEPMRLDILNWRTGRTVTRLVDSSSMQDIEFLSARSYILLHYGDDVGNVGRIEIFAFDKDCLNPPACVATLELPAFLVDQYISRIRIQAGPFCSKAIPGTPFSTSNENRIYMISVLYRDEYWCHLFVHFRFLNQFSLDRKHRTGTTVIPWEDWGPQNSRLLSGPHIGWMKHVHGERVVLPGNTPNVVQVLDFGVNPRRADAIEDSLHSTGFKTELHLEPTVFPVDGLFEHPVTTSLPYRSTWRILDEEFDRCFMDQDRIIGIFPSEDFDLSTRMAVYTF
ncbi:hypothetical protein B0H19DRAFT_1071811 [Mycena capillaripes]|nr:hypothetical protein B0H19DRAFT_1071811 [Mycena capillaripes]